MKGRKLSKNNRLKRSMIDSIYLMAIEKNKKTEIFDDPTLKIYYILKQGIQMESLVNYLKTNTSLDAKEIENELCNLLFLINHIMPEYLTMEEKIKFGKEFSEVKDNQLVNLAINTLNIFPNSENIADEIKYYFVYELVIRAIIFKYFPMWKFSLEATINEFLLEIQRKGFEELSEIYSDYLEKESLDRYVRRIIEISSPFVLFKNGNPINVYIEFTYKPHFKLILESTILFSYKEEAIKLVHDIEDAEVVISDSYPNVDGVEYFYFSDIYVQQNWEELNSFLQKKMLQRGFK